MILHPEISRAYGNPVAALSYALGIMFMVRKEYFSGKDIFRNYGYREDIVYEIISKNKYPFLEKDIGNKHDCVDTRSEKPKPWEIKTTGGAAKTKRINKFSINKKWEFDKQPDPVRRKETLEYGGYVFASFEDSYFLPLFVICVNSSSGAGKKMRDLLLNKQKVFVDKYNKSQAEGKRIRDTIQVSIKDIIQTFSEEDIVLLVRGDFVKEEKMRFVEKPISFLESVINIKL